MSDFVPLLVPRENANDEVVTVLEWLVKNGDPVAKDARVVVVETSKAAIEIESPADGFFFFDKKPGDEVAVGEPIAYVARERTFDIAAAKPAPAPKRRSSDKTTTPAMAVVRQGMDRQISFTRKAKALIREHGLSESAFADLEIVREQDVLQRIRAAEVGGSAAQIDAPFVAHRVSPTKAAEIRQLAKSYESVLYSKIVAEVPLAAVKRIADHHRRDAFQVTTGEILVFATSRLLRDPELDGLNAFFGDNVVNKYQEVNVGIAMNIGGQGLRVPVIKNADKLSLRETAVRVKELGLRYMRGKLTVDDLRGGTFTVTDLSSAGVVSFDPVINAAQSAILGICSPGRDASHFNVVVAFDHRVLDGMLAAQFTGKLVALLGSLPLDATS